jgi:hypothetical protein
MTSPGQPIVAGQDRCSICPVRVNHCKTARRQMSEFGVRDDVLVQGYPFRSRILR